MKKLTALVIICAVLLSGCGCRPVNMMEKVPARAISLADPPVKNVETADFSVRLLQNCFQSGENVLLSPLSVLTALAMTANGAAGENLQQMEQTLNMTVQDMNAYLFRFTDPVHEELKLANSIWFRDTKQLTVVPEFLETNANYYQADVYRAAFNTGTMDAINDWVSTHTDGMIPKILEEIPENAVMYLVNALAFEARWQTVYEDFQVQEGIFTTESGKEQAVQMMHSKEREYLEDERATGFLKYYAGVKYGFAALLPKEGISLEAYVHSLTGESLQNILQARQDTDVFVTVPKFEAEFDADLSLVLKDMGMKDAFDLKRADFSAMATSAEGNIAISRILHKTHITVAEQGTRAGAATMVEMVAGEAPPAEEPKEVILDRPFVYMIVDCEENIPVFIGTMMDMEQ